jgi:hypothetical protein
MTSNVDDKVSWLPASVSKLSNTNDMLDTNETPKTDSHAPLSGVMEWVCLYHGKVTPRYGRCPKCNCMVYGSASKTVL